MYFHKKFYFLIVDKNFLNEKLRKSIEKCWKRFKFLGRR